VDDLTLRRVEEELHGLTASGAELHRNSALATYLPGQVISPDRLRFQRCLLDDLIDGEKRAIKTDGRAALVTAGPPGAGKSTLVEKLDLAGDGWRVIDADVIKVRLLEAGVQDGIFQSILVRTLADGYPVMPNELSSLVHNESVFLADLLMERCLGANENVVIEGTLSWDGLPRKYAKLLELNEYETVTIVDVEVDCAAALERAYTRWANGRIKAIDGELNGGGRYTPREAITSLYDGTGQFSVCNQNAVDFFNSDGVSGFSEVELIVATGPQAEDQQNYKRIVGKYTAPPPGYLKDSEPSSVPTFLGLTFPAAVVSSANANKDLLDASPVPSREQMKSIVADTARRMGLDPFLALAFALEESGFDQRAVSDANAIGTMQVIPSSSEWASELVGRKLNLLDPYDNVTAGVAIIRQLILTSEDLETAIAGYYQGQYSVSQYGMYEDTKSYVASIKAHRAGYTETGQ
jgi:adenylate kinase family enzyme